MPSISMLSRLVTALAVMGTVVGCPLGFGEIALCFMIDGRLWESVLAYYTKAAVRLLTFEGSQSWFRYPSRLWKLSLALLPSVLATTWAATLLTFC